jgi:Gas vesicle synthesis protein GvpL/GvpF
MNLYVYGFVTPSKTAARQLTVDGHRIELLSVAGLEVAVERLDERPAISETALRLQHAIVTRLARRCDAVLPARFGSLVTFEDLERIVALRTADLRKALRKVRGRAQMTLRIVASPAVVAPAPSVDKPTSGTAYLAYRMAALSGTRPPAAAALARGIGTLVHDERIETTDSGRTSIFHLIDSADVREYRAAINGVRLPEGERVSVTGPFPPFAFAPELWT